MLGFQGTNQMVMFDELILYDEKSGYFNVAYWTIPSARQ